MHVCVCVIWHIGAIVAVADDIFDIFEHFFADPNPKLLRDKITNILILFGKEAAFLVSFFLLVLVYRYIGEGEENRFSSAMRMWLMLMVAYIVMRLIGKFDDGITYYIFLSLFVVLFLPYIVIFIVNSCKSFYKTIIKKAESEEIHEEIRETWL